MSTRDNDEETETPFTIESNEEEQLLPDKEREKIVLEGKRTVDDARSGLKGRF